MAKFDFFSIFTSGYSKKAAFSFIYVKIAYICGG